jgi:hypothetical protein
LAGYSGTPLARKLGIKPGIKAFFRDVPAAVVAQLAPALADVRMVRSLEPELDFIFGFARAEADLRKEFAAWERHLAKTGCIWVSWPKKTSGVVTDLSDAVVRAIGLKSALVDTKVCAVDEQWSALKFVYRKADR